MSISLVNLHPPPADLQRLVRDGLRRSPRQLPAWMLYDVEGSRLFAEICRQPEYTLTQREIALLEENAAAIAAATGPGLVVEFGIGNARKVDPLLTALQQRLRRLGHQHQRPEGGPLRPRGPAPQHRHGGHLL